MKPQNLTLGLAVLLGLAAPVQAQDQAAAQPAEAPIPFAGGATAISETHGDWTLVCGTREQQRTCVISQSLANEQTGQRIVSLEIEPKANGELSGSLVLPFGLKLSEGIKTHVDAVPVGGARPFEVCYDYGCVATFTLDAGSADLLKRGTDLNLIGIVADSGQNVTLSVPLGGISSALARSLTLTAE